MSKIIFINRFFAPDHSASSQMLSDLAFALARGESNIHVVTSRLRYEHSQQMLPNVETMEGVTVHRVWTSSFGRGGLVGRALDYLSFYVTSFWCLLLLLGRGDVVVAMTDPPMVSVIARWAATVRGALLVNWVQDLFPEVAAELGVSIARGWLGRFLIVLRDGSLQAAALNVVLSERMAEAVGARGVAASRVRVIQNWADGAAIKPLDAALNPLRWEWGLTGKFVVGYSGNLGRAHDIDTLLGVAEQLVDDESIRFVIIGSGTRREMLEKAARERGLRNVMFKPYQPRDMLDLSLTVADVHLVSLDPSLEGLIVPSKFYGVTAAGRATLFIGALTGSIGSIIHSAGCGETVVPGGVSVMVDLIREWSRDPAQVRAMGARAREWFDRNGEMRIAIAAWERALGALVEEPALAPIAKSVVR